MHQQLINACSLVQVIAPAAGVAGTTAINGTVVDMADCNGALFIVTFGAITSTAVTTIKLQASDDNAVADDYSDLAGTSQAVADTDDEKIFYIDIMRPSKRYLRLVVSRGTANAVVAAASCLKYFGQRKQPVTHAAAVSGEAHVSPLEGTA